MSLSELRAAAAEFDGVAVQVELAVVLAEDRFDEAGTGRTGTVHVVDPGNPMAGGLQLFSPTVNARGSAPLEPGDLVALRGEFVVFRGANCPASGDCGGNPGCFCFAGRTLPQFGLGASVERVGFWQDPEPITLTPEQYAASPDQFLGNLVTIRDLTVTTPYETLATRIGAASTSSGVDIAADLYVIEGLQTGDRLRSVTGIAGYFFSDFIMPRSAADVEFAP